LGIRIGNPCIDTRIIIPVSHNFTFGATSMTPIAFARRLNSNSTTDSICLKCFRTIATAKSIEELEERERAHACEPLEIRFKPATKGQDNSSLLWFPSNQEA
jgi:hypothetical protein